jgi:hypothetical protein
MLRRAALTFMLLGSIALAAAACGPASTESPSTPPGASLEPASPELTLPSESVPTDVGSPSPTAS